MHWTNRLTHAQQKSASNVVSCMATHRRHFPVIVGLTFQNKHELLYLVQSGHSVQFTWLNVEFPFPTVFTASLYNPTVQVKIDSCWDKSWNYYLHIIRLPHLSFYGGVIKCSGTHFVSEQTTGRSLSRADEYMLYVYRQIESEHSWNRTRVMQKLLMEVYIEINPCNFSCAM
jgi:hypothetical protein